MEIGTILSAVDHTLLSPTATWAEIQTLCDEAVAYRTASVCVPPCYVRNAASYLAGRVPICTVVGFPHGNSTTGTKLFAAKNAVMDGADEVDMVVNLGYIKDGRFDTVFSEISGLKAMVGEEHVLKVIVETALLTEEEKIRMCLVAGQAGADFIKTSTGYGGGGATVEDIRLFASHADPNLKIKASGGIDSLEAAALLLENGAHRLGSSKLVALARRAGDRV